MRRKHLLFSLALAVLSSSFVTAQEDTPYIFILGVAQDAGFPQIGCYAEHCLPGWENPDLRRGATSLGVIDPAAGQKYLFEATPNVPEQLYALDNEAPNDRFDLAGVFLTHAHIGHYAGLMFFGHEAMGSSSQDVYAMPRMGEFLRHNGPWSQLVEFENIRLQELQDQRVESFANVQVTPFLVPHRDEFSETVGYEIAGPNKKAVFIPDINKWSAWDIDLVELLRSVDYALLDATFYADGELPGRDMSQIPHPFVSETMAALDALPPSERAKVWFIHFNHSNPLLNESSEQSQFVSSQGYNVAKEGVRLPL